MQEQEKSEEATAKRLREAKEQGDLPFSEDLFKASFLLAALLLLWLFSHPLTAAFQHLFRHSFSHLNCLDRGQATREVLVPFLWPLVSLMGALFFLTFFLYCVQRGFLFAVKKKTLPPSKERAIPALFFLAKGLVILATALLFFRFAPRAPFTLFTFSLTLSLALCGLGVGDLFYQRFAWRKRMRMTKEEVKEERRESEGNRR